MSRSSLCGFVERVGAGGLQKKARRSGELELALPPSLPVPGRLPPNNHHSIAMSSSLPPLPSLPLLSLPNVPLSFTLPPSTSAIPNTHGTAPNPSTLRVHSSTTRTTNRHNPQTRSARSRRGTPSAPSGAGRSAGENTNVPASGSSAGGAGTRAWAEANARGGLERALNGRLPFGMDLVQEERDLSEEEDEWEDKVRYSEGSRPGYRADGVMIREGVRTLD